MIGEPGVGSSRWVADVGSRRVKSGSLGRRRDLVGELSQAAITSDQNVGSGR
jgi:hypothetical protein